MATMEVFHKVPHYEQESSMTCGIAVLRMIMGWLGVSVTEKELVKEIPVFKDSGTYYADLALALYKRGFKTKLYSHEVNLFNPYKELKNEAVIKAIKKNWKHLSEKSKRKGEAIIKYIEGGGEFIVTPSKIDKLNELLKNQPLVVPLLLPFLRQDKFGTVGHYVAVIGFDGKNYLVLDPGSDKSNPREYKVPQRLFELGWIANNADSDAYLMEVIR